MMVMAITEEDINRILQWYEIAKEQLLDKKEDREIIKRLKQKLENEEWIKKAKSEKK